MEKIWEYNVDAYNISVYLQQSYDGLNRTASYKIHMSLKYTREVNENDHVQGGRIIHIA